MTTDAEWIQIDPERVLASLEQNAAEAVKRTQGEVTLDFSGVRRLDTNGIGALEHLAAMAEERGSRLVVHGVNGDIYKVLKLLKLAGRFSFTN